MSELSFAKQFLAALDSRPIRIPSDHVEDPKEYPARTPYILPPMPHPPPKRQRLAPGQEPSLTVVLKSLRNPPLDVSLLNQPVSTSILELKQATADRLGGGVKAGNVRLLYKKKPCGDLKTLKELVGEGERAAEFSVMVVGIVPASSEPKSEDTLSSGNTKDGGLDTEEFWQDLKGYLVQRTKDVGQAERAHDIFREAWSKQSA